MGIVSAAENIISKAIANPSLNRTGLLYIKPGNKIWNPYGLYDFITEKLI